MLSSMAGRPNIAIDHRGQDHRGISWGAFSRQTVAIILGKAEPRMWFWDGREEGMTGGTPATSSKPKNRFDEK